MYLPGKEAIFARKATRMLGDQFYHNEWGSVYMFFPCYSNQSFFVAIRTTEKKMDTIDVLIFTRIKIFPLLLL